MSESLFCFFILFLVVQLVLFGVSTCVMLLVVSSNWRKDALRRP